DYGRTHALIAASITRGCMGSRLLRRTRADACGAGHLWCDGLLGQPADSRDRDQNGPWSLFRGCAVDDCQDGSEAWWDWGWDRTCRVIRAHAVDVKRSVRRQLDRRGHVRTRDINAFLCCNRRVFYSCATSAKVDPMVALRYE